MRNKLVFKLIDPTIKNWRDYNSCEVKNVISLCQTLGVRVYDHFNEESKFTRHIYVEFKEEKTVVNCIIQISRYLESKNLNFELVERTEINDDFKFEKIS